jgi:hypothetical protein
MRVAVAPWIISLSVAGIHVKSPFLDDNPGAGRPVRFGGGMTATSARRTREPGSFHNQRGCGLNWVSIGPQMSQAQTMPRHSPIEIPVPLTATLSDLIGFRWETDGVAADFLLPGDSIYPRYSGFCRRGAAAPDQSERVVS